MKTERFFCLCYLWLNFRLRTRPRHFLRDKRTCGTCRASTMKMPLAGFKLITFIRTASALAFGLINSKARASKDSVYQSRVLHRVIILSHSKVPPSRNHLLRNSVEWKYTKQWNNRFKRIYTETLLQKSQFLKGGTSLYLTYS